MEGPTAGDVPGFITSRGNGTESKDEADDASGIPRSTLERLYENRRDLYLSANAEDDRVDVALDELRPLDDLEPREGEE